MKSLPTVVFIAPTLGNAVGDEQFSKLVRHAYAGFSPYLRIVCLPGRGLGPIEETFARLAPKLDQITGEELTIIGWSQGALMALLYAMRRPGRVVKLILLAPPCNGSPLARLIPDIVDHVRVEFAKDMKPGSAWLQQFQTELTQHAFDLPQLYVFTATHDVVVPLSSSRRPELARAEYRHFGLVMPKLMPTEIMLDFVPVHSRINHLNLGFHSDVLPYIERAIAGVELDIDEAA